MGIKIISENRKAHFGYHVEERLEAGIMLQGCEVKSLRAGHANMGDAYASVKNGEVFLMHLHISPYQVVGHIVYDPMRVRKLLLNKQEIKKLTGRVEVKGMTLIPLKLYFKEGKAKVELGLCKSKDGVDKRATIKQREDNRQVQRELKNRGRG